MSKKTADKTDADATDDLSELNFETALDELEGLVAQLEEGDLSLEDSLSAFERGVKLTRRCQSALQAAELRVKVLTEEGQLEDFDTASVDDA